MVLSGSVFLSPRVEENEVREEEKEFREDVALREMEVDVAEAAALLRLVVRELVRLLTLEEKEEKKLLLLVSEDFDELVLGLFFTLLTSLLVGVVA